MTKGILFNQNMVRAILDGRKTVTRRLVKPQPTYSQCDGFTWKGGAYGTDLPPTIKGAAYNFKCAAPYQPGDILYVRESVFQGVGHYLDVSGETVSVLTNDFEYYADGLHEKDHWKDKYERTWMHRRPSIHMPKEAARIWLKVKDVRVERLQEITEEQAKEEGAIDNRGFIHSPDNEYDSIHTAKEHFEQIWNSTIKKSDLDRYGWDANPWVWVIEFERCEKLED